MKTRVSLLLLSLALLLATSACVVAVSEPPRSSPPLPPPPPVRHYDTSIFYDDLEPYGAWFLLEPYGYVWSPYDVDRGWRPYTDGRWIYTEYGWTWVSEREWGWAVFHYGRWLLHPRYGWVWVPGTEWAPAWVAWRQGGGWIGWAPLPPEVRWRVGLGLDFGGGDIDVVIRPSAWCFIQEVHILEPRIAERVAPETRNVTVVRITKNVTRYTVVDKRIVNHGVAVDAVERVVKKPVPRLRVMDSESPGAARRQDVDGRDVRFFRPTIEEAPRSKAPRVTSPPKDRPEPDEGVRPPRTGPHRAPAPEGREGNPPSPPPARPAPPPRTPPGAEPPRDAPRPGASPTLRRHEAERNRMEQLQAAERKSLEDRQRAEREDPKVRVPREELLKRQEAERKALEERQSRDRKQLEDRQSRQRQGRERPGDSDKSEEDKKEK